MRCRGWAHRDHMRDVRSPRAPIRKPTLYGGGRAGRVTPLPSLVEWCGGWYRHASIELGSHAMDCAGSVAHGNVYPPSMTWSAPVVYDASSETKYSAR